MSPVLDIRGLRVRLGGRTVVDGVDLTLGPGELVALMGRSGTGKSVFIKAAVGLLDAEAGAVLLDGAPATPAQVRQRVVLVHQSPALLDGRTVWDNVWGPLQWRGVKAAPARERAMAALEACGVPGPWTVPASALSAGERKRVALARALAQQPAALLLDEPTTGLDAPSAARVAETCGRLRARGLGLVVVTHDLAPFANVYSRCVLLHHGRVVCTQTADEVKHTPHPALQQLLAGGTRGPLTDANDIAGA